MNTNKNLHMARFTPKVCRFEKVYFWREVFVRTSNYITLITLWSTRKRWFSKSLLFQYDTPYIAIFSSNGTVTVHVGNVKNTGYKSLELVTTFPPSKYNLYFFFKNHIHKYVNFFLPVNLYKELTGSQ